MNEDIIMLTWGALWQNSSSVREASIAPSTLKLSSGTEGNCSCRLAHCTQAATSAALQRLGSAIKTSNLIISRLPFEKCDIIDIRIIKFEKLITNPLFIFTF